jgi:serine acetyltransferase
VINNINICDNVTVGVGAVVIRDIKAKGTYFGVVASSGRKGE